MLIVGGACDLVSIVTTLLLPTIIGALAAIISCLILDFFCLIIVGSWMYSRASGKKASTEEEEEEIDTIEEPEITLPDTNLTKKDRAATKADAKESEKGVAKATEKDMAQEAERAAATRIKKTTTKRVVTKTAVKTAARSGGKIALKLFRSFVGTLVPIIQVFPFWSLTVVSELKND